MDLKLPFLSLRWARTPPQSLYVRRAPCMAQIRCIRAPQNRTIIVLYTQTTWYPTCSKHDDTESATTHLRNTSSYISCLFDDLRRSVHYFGRALSRRSSALFSYSTRYASSRFFWFRRWDGSVCRFCGQAVCLSMALKSHGIPYIDWHQCDMESMTSIINYTRHLDPS